MKFKKPVAKIELPQILKEYEDINGVKVYTSFWNRNVPDKLISSEELQTTLKSLERIISDNRALKVGELFSGNGNYIRDIELHECVNFNKGYDEMTSVSEYDKSLIYEYQVRFYQYQELKFRMRNNHLKHWLSQEEIKQLNAQTPQQLDDKGYLTLTEDKQYFALVDYDLGVRHQELKDVYCSVNGRYIKYKGKNYYIKEN